MRKKLLDKYFVAISTICFLFISACSENNDENNAILENVSVYTLSSSITENNLKSAQVVKGDDYIWGNSSHAALTLKVIGVTGKLDEVWLMANSGGDLCLFEGREIDFDLSELQKIIESEPATIRLYGDLNTVIVKVKYIDLTVLFKGIQSVIRLVAQDDGVAGAKVWDIMLKDADGTFKWLNATTRELFAERPTDESSVMKMNSCFVGNGDDSFWLGMDNFSNVDWVQSPPPWTERYLHDPIAQGGRYDIFYTLSESSISKKLNIYLDICFANAANFSPYKGIAVDSENDFDWGNPYFYNVGGDYSIDEITDLEGNPFSSDEFNIIDILPGITYPDVIVNVLVEEEDL